MALLLSLLPAAGLAAPNHKPVASGQSITAYPNVAKTVTLVATDADGNPLTYRLTSRPASGARLYNGPSTASNVIGSGAPMPFNLASNKITYLAPVSFTGSDSFTFRVYDGTVNSDIVTVSINVEAPVPPTVTLSNPTNGQNFTDQALTAIDGTVTDNSPHSAGIADVRLYLLRANPAGSGYEYYSGAGWTVYPTSTAAVNATIATTVSGGNWSCTGTLPPGLLESGTYTVRAVAIDNEGIASAPASAIIKVVSGAPTVDIDHPTAGQNINGDIVPQIDGTVTDHSLNFAGINRVEVLLYRPAGGGGIEYWTGSGWTVYPTSAAAVSAGATIPNSITGATGEGATWTCDSNLPNALNGRFTLRAQAFDNNGAGSVMAYCSFNAATTPPTITINRPTANQQFTNAAFTQLDGSLTDNSPGLKGINRVELMLYRKGFNGGGFQYWTGSAWTSFPSLAAAEAGGGKLTTSITSGIWWYAGLPTGLQNSGNYYARVQAFDNLKAASSIITVGFKIVNGPPTADITNPNAGLTVNGSLAGVDGTVQDNSPNHVGINRLELLLYRPNPGGGFQYWTGTDWTVFASSAAALTGGGALATHITGSTTTGATWSCTSPLPTSLPSGPYHLRLAAFDNSGLSSAVLYRNFSSSPPVAAPGIGSGLSTASANAATGTVTLAFNATLDANTAADATLYTMTVGGETVDVQGVAVTGNQVRLSLGSLRSGDAVRVSWSGVGTSNGQTFAGQSGAIVAR